MVDVLLMGAEAEHAHATEKPAVRGAAGQHHPSSARCLLDQCLRRRVLVGIGRARPRYVEGEQRQFGRSVDDDMRQRGDSAPGVERQPPLFGDRVTKGGRAEKLQREPDAQPGKGARQLGSVLTGIVEVLRRRHRRKVGSRGLVR